MTSLCAYADAAAKEKRFYVNLRCRNDVITDHLRTKMHKEFPAFAKRTETTAEGQVRRELGFDLCSEAGDCKGLLDCPTERSDAGKEVAGETSRRVRDHSVVDKMPSTPTYARTPLIAARGIGSSSAGYSSGSPSMP